MTPRCCCCLQEVKYRQLRLNNPRIKTLIVKVSGALEFLAAVGFQIHAADPGAAAGSDDDGFAVFIDDHQLGLVHEGLRQLQGAFPAAQSAQDQYLQQSAPVVSASALKQMPAVTHTPTPAAQLPDGVEINALARVAASSTPLTIVPAAPRRIPRDTLVLLPAAPDTTVPDWFFERTGAELKADYMAMLKVRQAGQVIASKAWQEAQSGRQSGPKPTVAVVRVRFPEVSSVATQCCVWSCSILKASILLGWHSLLYTHRENSCQIEKAHLTRYRYECK